MKVKIEKQDHFGRGLTRINGKLVFVEDGLPNEECEINIISEKKNYMMASIKERLTNSNDRVEVKCPYYSECGGCHIMHQSYSSQLEFKENKVKELLERFGKIDNIKVSKIKYGNQFNYRNKVIFHGKEGKLGYYKENSNDLVCLDTCLLLDKKILEVYHQILENCTDFYIKELMIRKTSLNEVMVSIKGDVDKSVLLDIPNINSLYINDKLIKGNSYIIENMNDINFRIYPTSFFQVNYEMMKEMYKIVINYFKNNPTNKVLDLYCGTGTIGMLVSKYVNSVVGVEVESSSIKSAIECSKLNNISNIKFIEGRVEDKIDEFDSIDSIIVDPPRSGLTSSVIETIIKIRPQSIIYISCDPVTLARDLKTLTDEYEILEVDPIDMFPNTYHVECVSVLHRKTLKSKDF